MRLLPWLVSFYFPLCGTIGAAGITPPGPIDLAHFTRAEYSTALIAPPGFPAQPDITAAAFNIPAATLFADLQRVAAAQPRTYPLSATPAQFQASYIVRSAAFNFPDLVEIATIPLGPSHSTYIFYSHSLYGYSDYGVNLARAKTWATALQKSEKKSEETK